MRKLLPFLALFIIAAPVQAHQRHTRTYYGPWITWYPAVQHPHPRVHRPRVRVGNKCVYNPWKNKLVCRF